MTRIKNRPKCEVNGIVGRVGKALAHCPHLIIRDCTCGTTKPCQHKEDKKEEEA